MGRWHIVYTSLDFWRNRFNPTVTYTLEGERILDEVRYTNERGSPQQVVGYDVVLHHGGSLFQWRAKDWYLRFLTSQWGVIDHDDACEQWAMTYFSKTLFTAAGMDIYARAPVLDDAPYQQILTRIAQLEFLHEHVAALYPTRRWEEIEARE